MPNRIPPKIDLAAYANEHLRYEAWMFVEAHQHLPVTRPGSFEMNAMVESCLFHFRNLLDFFYPRVLRVDDVIAADYVPDWDSKRPALSSVLETARKRVDKELAHLTTQRISGAPPQKMWDFGTVSLELQPVIETFIRVAHGLSVEAVAVLRAI
ncbi:MAG: hypothetical protein WBL65_21240 [Bryobacteraceae bacterium]